MFNNVQQHRVNPLRPLPHRTLTLPKSAKRQRNVKAVSHDLPGCTRYPKSTTGGLVTATESTYSINRSISIYDEDHVIWLGCGITVMNNTWLKASVSLRCIFSWTPGDVEAKLLSLPAV
ncbi:Hypothetical predicted protein [Scomber scombrus]|uniref:Uncharacterized protein n=1 Tax=Scomber scombrus TaxID=13677 RepID=A0AAV1N1A3_SCOSC